MLSLCFHPYVSLLLVQPSAFSSPVLPLLPECPLIFGKFPSPVGSSSCGGHNQLGCKPSHNTLEPSNSLIKIAEVAQTASTVLFAPAKAPLSCQASLVATLMEPILGIVFLPSLMQFHYTKEAPLKSL